MKNRFVINENQVRSLIRKILVEVQVGHFKGGSDPYNRSGKKGKSYDGPLVSVGSDGKKYLGDPKIGMSPPGYWNTFRNELNNHINREYPELGVEIDNLGITRDLQSAADTGGNTARVAGSKHGAGLAQDVYIHTKKYGKFTSYEKDNPKLAKDQKLVDSIISFLETPEYKGKVYWGGAFNSGGKSLSKGETPKGRGITEFHHFEFGSEDMPSFFSEFEDELSKLGFKSQQLTSTKMLGRLYGALLTAKVSDSSSTSTTTRRSSGSSSSRSSGGGDSKPAEKQYKLPKGKPSSSLTRKVGEKDVKMKKWSGSPYAVGEEGQGAYSGAFYQRSGQDWSIIKDKDLIAKLKELT